MTRNIYAHLVILGTALLFSPAVHAADAAHVAKYKSGANACQADGPCDLSNADLSGIKRNFMNLEGANAQGANFSGSKLSNMNISKADFSGANLSSTTWTAGALLQSNLTGANLQGLVGKWSFEFNSNDLRNANLTGAKIDGLEKPDYGNKFCNTTMPDGTISNRDC